MSLVTSCPHCSVIFVVRPEQLAAQQGKVRCGSCRQVFNALDSLQEPVLDSEHVQHTSAAKSEASQGPVVIPLAEDDSVNLTAQSASPEYPDKQDDDQPAAPVAEDDLPAAPPPLAPETESGLEADITNTLAPEADEVDNAAYVAEATDSTPVITFTDTENSESATADNTSSHYSQPEQYAESGETSVEADDTLDDKPQSDSSLTIVTSAAPKLNDVISGLLVPIDLSPAQAFSAEQPIASAPTLPATETLSPILALSPLPSTESVSNVYASDVPDPSTGNSSMLEIVDTEAPSAFSDIAIEDKLKLSRKRRISTLSIVVISLILLILAAVQTVYFMRTPISTEWPILRPHLVAACKFFGCVLELPRNADLLTVDDSDLQEDNEHPGVIRLRSTLINNARYTQQYPLLELTLTDANQAPVLRRTFKPAEYLPAGSDIKAGLAANDEVHINLLIATKEASVSSYRVYITY